MGISRLSKFMEPFTKPTTEEEHRSNWDYLRDWLTNKVNSVPPGTVVWTVGTTADDGYLLCDGASYQRKTYPLLFARCQTQYGAADATHFNVPNIASREIIGAGTGAGLTTRTNGQTGGGESFTLSQANLPNVNFTVTDPTHRHFDGDDTGGNTTPDAVANGFVAAHQEPGAGTAGNKRTSFAATGISVSSGGSGTAVANMNPFVVLTAQIKW